MWLLPAPKSPLDIAAVPRTGPAWDASGQKGPGAPWFVPGLYLLQSVTGSVDSTSQSTLTPPGR